MGDLAADTAVDGGGGRYTGTVSKDWSIFSPHGGYLSAIAFRAAAAESALPRPVSFAAHYLAAPAHDEVTLEVRPLREGRAATSLRVSMTQGDKPILEALVWFAAPNDDAPTHDQAALPDTPGPADVEQWPHHYPFPFWDRLELRTIDFTGPWQDQPVGSAARWRSWHRFRERATYDDPILDACRYVVLLDCPFWGASSRPHADLGMEWFAPSLDYYVAFHQAAPQREWLLMDCVAPVLTDGIGGGQAQLWSDDGRLVATAGQTILWRRNR